MFDGRMDRILQMSAHPMVIVTVTAGGERDGCLVGYHTPTSISPRRYLVLLSTQNRTYDLAMRTETLVVHHVETHHIALARLFGEETGYEIDKFQRCEWSSGPDDVPVLDDIETWWAGRILERVPLGDHTGFLLEPFVAEAGDDLDPLDSQTAGAFDAGNPRRSRRT